MGGGDLGFMFPAQTTGLDWPLNLFFFFFFLSLLTFLDNITVATAMIFFFFLHGGYSAVSVSCFLDFFFLVRISLIGLNTMLRIERLQYIFTKR